MAVVSIKNKLRRGNLLVGNEAYTPVDFFSIATVTVGSSGASTIEFTGIPQTYNHLQIRATYFQTDTANPYMRLGGNSIDTSSNYSWHHLYGTGSSVPNNGGSSQTFIYFGYTTNSTNPNAGVIDILDYTSVNKNKTVRILAGQDNNGSGEIALWSGAWYNSSTAIEKITFYPVNGTFKQYTHFALYGIKGA